MKFGICLVICSVLLTGVCMAGEVGKGQIPADHVADATKVLPWNVAIWDVDEAVAAVKDKSSKILWVDTRPTSFFEQGTVRDAVLMVYDKSGASYPDGEPLCGKDALLQKMEETGANVVVFFCQGPKCHRSYNAAYVAVEEWGLDASQVVWFRAGYPSLFKAVSETAKLKRKAKRYVCDASMAKF
jgi:Rhodanese-like domain